MKRNERRWWQVMSLDYVENDTQMIPDGASKREAKRMAKAYAPCILVENRGEAIIDQVEIK